MPGDLDTIRDLLTGLREDAMFLERTQPNAIHLRHRIERLTEAIQEREVETWNIRHAATQGVDCLRTR